MDYIKTLVRLLKDQADSRKNVSFWGNHAPNVEKYDRQLAALLTNVHNSLVALDTYVNNKLENK